MKFELISQDSRYITYRKGDRHNNICVEFDLELKHIYITESMYTQQVCPTLGMDDLEFINQKANELFDKERETE